LIYLLDTNVVSEMRKAQTGRADPAFQRWINHMSLSESYISAISILEMQTGVLRMMRKDQRQGEMLRKFLHEHVIPVFKERTLGVDAVIALRCAALHVPVTVAYNDALIAATALVHGMTVVTRNVKDFAPMGVRVLNPWV
jgi:predicted nucleic acid-binding protein